MERRAVIALLGGLLGFHGSAGAYETNCLALLDSIVVNYTMEQGEPCEQLGSYTNYGKASITSTFAFASSCFYPTNVLSINGAYAVSFQSSIAGTRNTTNAWFTPANPVSITPSISASLHFLRDGWGAQGWISAFMGWFESDNYGITSNAVSILYPPSNSIHQIEATHYYQGRDLQIISDVSYMTIVTGGRIFLPNSATLEYNARGIYLLIEGAGNTFYATNVTPADGAQLTQGATATLLADIRCKLRTLNEANLELKAFNQAGELLAVGRTRYISSADPEQTYAMQIPGTNDAPPFIVPSNTTKVVLKARLEDVNTSELLLETVCAEYPVVEGNRVSMQLGEINLFGNYRFDAVGTNPPLWCGNLLTYNPRAARVTYLVNVGAPAILGMRVAHEIASGDVLYQSSCPLTPISQSMAGAPRQEVFDITRAIQSVHPGVDFLVLQAILISSDGSYVTSREEVLPVNWLTVSNLPGFATLQAGSMYTFQPDITYAINGDGGRPWPLTREKKYWPSIASQDLRNNLRSGARENFRDDFQVSPTPASCAFAVNYRLGPTCEWGPLYSVVHSNTIPAGAGHTVEAAPGVTIKTTLNNSPRAIFAQSVNGDASLDEAGGATTRRRLAMQSGVSTQSQVYTIGRYWTFSPAIPADGSFEADLEFAYTTNDLPGDPRCAEHRLRVLTPDEPAGGWLALPTLLDVSNHTARVRVDRLAGQYTLGAVSPFMGGSLVLPVFHGSTNEMPETLLAVNAGAIEDAATLSAWLNDGTLLSNAPAAALYAPHAGTNAAATALIDVSNAPLQGWIRIEGEQDMLAGGARLGAGARLDFLAATDQRGNAWVLPDACDDGTNAVEITIVNPTPWENALTLTLRSDTGVVLATRSDVLPAHGRLSATLPLLFRLTNHVESAWVSVSSRHASVAAQVRSSASSLAAMQAVPPYNTVVTLVSPFFRAGGGNRFCWVNLVNTTTNAIDATLSCTWDSGVPVGSPVALAVPPQGQCRREIAALFGLASTPCIGSLTVQTPAGGVCGSLTLIEDNGTLGEGRAWLPLQDRSLYVAVIPYQGHCGIQTLNTNAFSIYVSGSVYDTTGEPRYDTVRTLAAGRKQSEDWFPSWNPPAAEAGHIILRCNSPFYACAMEYGSSAGNPWIEARPAAIMDGRGIDFTDYRPMIDVNPGGLVFGRPQLEGPESRPIQIANRGAADLQVTGAGSDSGCFAVNIGSLPFTLPAGGYREGTVTYQAASTFSTTGTISITNNDSLQRTVYLPVSAGDAVFTISAALTNQSFLLSWPGVATNGRLQFATNLMGAGWIDVPRAPDVFNGRCVIVTNPAPAKGAYRVLAR